MMTTNDHLRSRPVNTTIAHSVEASASPLDPPFTDEFVRRMVATRKPT